MKNAVKGHTGRRASGGCESQRTRARHLCVLLAASFPAIQCLRDSREARILKFFDGLRSQEVL
jgi:hypothetical protein